MEPEQRYQFVATIGSGEFATVYRARDVELARDVAIKQIHAQYLQDPRQLERYWYEAQILANLHHQFIMAIYDIVRHRGWMILELMRGSLPAELQGRPIDIETLKIALVQSLHALDFLHSRSVLHGDIKPSNLLIGMNGRLKLGDFGLARRAANGEGSLLKGTPKYMAPEVMSDRFGPVGPSSDLYSLGFTCYELLCGAHFESLFPGLSSFGRDRTVAWMMWHSAPDRRLPPIQRVLDGVPDNIAAVIERLILKDPAARYHTAAEVLQELREGPVPTADPAADATRLAAQRRRRLAIGAFTTSAVLSLGLAFWPTNRGRPQGDTQVAASAEVRSGRIRELFESERKIVLVVPEDRRPLEISVPTECEIRLNGDRFLLLRELNQGDEVRVTLAKGKRNELSAQAIDVVRPDSLAGLFQSVDVRNSRLVIDVPSKGNSIEPRIFQLPEGVELRFNGQAKFDGQRVGLDTFKAGDRVAVRYFTRGDRREAVTVDGYRLVSLTGSLKLLNIEEHRLVLTASGEEFDFPLSKDCKVTLNGDFASPRDLAPGDEVTIEHDVEAVSIDARRGP
jgi:hypothetical protein